MGGCLDLPTLSCIVCVEGVIVVIFGLFFLVVESEVTRKEFPSIVVSSWTYFWGLTLFVTYLLNAHCLLHFAFRVAPIESQELMTQIKDFQIQPLQAESDYDERVYTFEDCPSNMIQVIVMV